MLDIISTRDINREVLLACLTAHASRSFSGDLTFHHAGEMIHCERVEIHVERQPCSEWKSSIEEHLPAVVIFIDRVKVALEVSFRTGKITRTLVRSA